jgi:hypothetical protein
VAVQTDALELSAHSQRAQLAIQPVPPRQPAAVRSHQFFLAVAGRDCVHGRRDDRDGVSQHPNFLAAAGRLWLMILLVDT